MNLQAVAGKTENPVINLLTNGHDIGGPISMEPSVVTDTNSSAPVLAEPAPDNGVAFQSSELEAPPVAETAQNLMGIFELNTQRYFSSVNAYSEFWQKMFSAQEQILHQWALGAGPRQITNGNWFWNRLPTLSVINAADLM
jgi:hypothetical protein